VDNGLRGTKDGVTYFGCKKRGSKQGIRSRQSELLNDIVIKIKDQDIAQKHRGRHFKIEYSLSLNSYHVQDLALGFGTYRRIDSPLVLKNNYMLSMGDSFLIVNFISEPKRGSPLELPEGSSQSGINMRLRIKVFAGSTNGET
jgi:hypothetical protein